jgi:hypothetical protein
MVGVGIDDDELPYDRFAIIRKTIFASDGAANPRRCDGVEIVCGDSEITSRGIDDGLLLGDGHDVPIVRKRDGVGAIGTRSAANRPIPTPTDVRLQAATVVEGVFHISNRPPSPRNGGDGDGHDRSCTPQKDSKKLPHDRADKAAGFQSTCAPAVESSPRAFHLKKITVMMM